MTEKLKDFLVSDEFFYLLSKINELLDINIEQDFGKVADVAVFLDIYFRERIYGEDLINYLKTNLSWLSEENLNNLLKFIQENLHPKREELWQEETSKTETETIPQESFEEKEKRYLELMKSIVKPIEENEKKTQQEQPKIEEVQKKTIVLEPEKKPLKEEAIVIEWEGKEEKRLELPKDTIIIKHKEKKSGEKSDEVIDLSEI